MSTINARKPEWAAWVGVSLIPPHCRVIIFSFFCVLPDLISELGHRGFWAIRFLIGFGTIGSYVAESIIVMCD